MFPGGRILIDGTLQGTDETGTVTLTPGTHEVKVENRFLGTHTATVNIEAGQTAVNTTNA